MKIVVNKCFGGFGVSPLAIKELVLRNSKCIETITPKSYYGGDNPNFKGRPWEGEWEEDFKDFIDIGDGFWANGRGFNVYKDGLLYDIISDDSVRVDKDLIDVITLMGDKSFGYYAKLSIIEIPDDVKWEIDDYDGMESIHEVHRSW